MKFDLEIIKMQNFDVVTASYEECEDPSGEGNE